MAESPFTPSLRRRACTNCTATKAKCTPFVPDKCERCHRLHKECHYANLAITRRSPRPRPQSRLQTLERKVEELAARQSNASHQSQESIPAKMLDHNASNSTGPDLAQWPVSTGPAGSTRLNGSIIDRGMVTRDTAQVLLARFRDNASSHFPFVIIPADASLELVRTKTPFLFLAVTATMAFDNPFLQHRLGEEFRQRALQSMISGSEKSLDLLQGLLVYTAWYCHFYQADKHQEFLLSQLCITLAHDLGLDKSRKREADRLGQCKPVATTDSNSSLANARMRAYVGTYCVSCLVASILRRRTALSYTKRMDYCCQLLSERKEYETDTLVPHIVHAQQLSQRILHTFSYSDLNDAQISGEYLVTLTSNAFFRDLVRLSLEAAPDYQNNSIAVLNLEYHVLRIMINEAALHEELWTGVNAPDHLLGSVSSEIARSKMRWQSLNSCKEFIHTFLSYRNQDLFYLTAFTYPRLYYVFITMAKLVFHDSNRREVANQSDTQDVHNQSWSITAVAKEADYLGLGKEVLDKFTAVATDFIGANGERDAMANLAIAMRTLMVGYEQQLNEIQGSLQSAATMSSSVEMARENTDATVDSTAYLSSQGTRNDTELGALDTMFTGDLSASTIWDEMLENFTMIPFSFEPTVELDQY